MALFALSSGVSAQTITLSQSFCSGTTPCVLTYHNDNTRDGVNPNETRFTPSFSFSSLSATTVSVDGLVYAQPLYVHSLHSGSNGSVGSCAAGTNVVFVATENNSVYAINAVNGSTCWQHHFQTGFFPETPIPYTKLATNPSGGYCYNLLPQAGITSTPVIDVSITPPVLYAVSSHMVTLSGGTTYSQILHALDATSGSELAYTDLTSDLGSSFVLRVENQRPALALSKASNALANVYVAWASNCDYSTVDGTNYPYDGWVAGLQPNYSSVGTGFSLLGTFTSEPTGGTYEGGIWMAGSGPAIDSQGNVYVAVGNGDAPPTSSAAKYGDSIVKVSSSLAEQDYYTPNDFAQLALGSGSNPICFAPACPPGQTYDIHADSDMGTGGVVLLSSSELVSVGKQGMMYVVPYSATANSKMGGLDGGGYLTSTGSDPTTTDCSTATSSSPGYIYQCFWAISSSLYDGTKSTNGIWGAPSFWSAGGSNQYMYGVGLHDYMFWYPYVSGTPSTFNTSAVVESDHEFARQGSSGISVGGTTSVTWDNSNSSNGVVWALDSNGYGRYNPNTSSFVSSNQAILYAYPAVPGNFNPSGQVTELWDSNQLSSYTTVMPGAVKFSVPTVADGYIFVAGGTPSYFGTTSCPAPTSLPFSCAGQLTILH